MEEQDAGKGLAQERHPSQSKQTAQESGRWILYYKDSHIRNFTAFVLNNVLRSTESQQHPKGRARPALPWVPSSTVACRDSHSSSARRRRTSQTKPLTCLALVIFPPIPFAFAKLIDKLMI